MPNKINELSNTSGMALGQTAISDLPRAYLSPSATHSSDRNESVTSLSRDVWSDIPLRLRDSGLSYVEGRAIPAVRKWQRL
jgi:hypothetical protein